MNREKFAWLMSVVLVAALAFDIPRSLGHRDDDYTFVRTLLDIHRQVSTNYVEAVDEQKLQQGAIDGMLGELDPFTNYVPPAQQQRFDQMLEGTFVGVGIQLDQTDKGDVQVVTPIEGSPALAAGIQAGDIILKVNGEELKNIRLPEVIKKIGGPDGTPVTLTVRHDDGKVQDLTIKRQSIVVPTIKGYRHVIAADHKWEWDYWVSKDPKIGYIRITQFTSDTFKGLKDSLDPLLHDELQGLVLDLRFNPGGRLDQAKEVVDLFVREGIIVKTKGRNRPEEVTYAKPEGTVRDFPMVVLVNEHSASASEIVAGSLKDNKRALIVGTRSYGKGSVQELIPLEANGGELKLTVAYYYLPSGRLVHRKKDSTDWGVDPTISIPMDSEQEKRLLLAQSDVEIFHHNNTTNPATAPATAPATQPTTQPVDPQLDAAVDALVRDINGGANTNVPAVPATQP
jgi:carboxyl-terminal processing protease